MILLGSEVIIIPIDDARKLVEAFCKPGTWSENNKLKRMDVFDALDALSNAVRRYDSDQEKDY